MSDIKEKIITEIKKIYDPEIPVNIYELGLIYKIEVDDKGRTSIKGIWAGGDCVDLGEELTVSAVAQGRDAAENIHETLMSKKGDPK